MSAGNVMSQMPALLVPVSLTKTSPGRMKASMAGQSADCVKWVAFASRGVRGPGKVGLGILCWGVDGRAVERAARRGLIGVEE